MPRGLPIAAVVLLVFGGVGLWLLQLPSAPQTGQQASAEASREPNQHNKPIKREAQLRATKAMDRRGGTKRAKPRPGELGGGPKVWTTEEIKRDRAALYEIQQRQRAENRDRYTRASKRFATETRDEPWATTREEQLRAEAERGGVQSMLVGADCRTSMCQLTWEVVDTHSFFRVRSSPAMGELGEDRASTTDGPPAERLWIVLGARQGHPLVEGPPVTVIDRPDPPGEDSPPKPALEGAPSVPQ